MKIFVIDDEPFALRLVRHQLRALSYTEITTHAHAVDALQALEHDPTAADVVLLDLQMPEMDGIEFVRHLARLKFPGAIILVSGEDERIVQTASRLAAAERVFRRSWKPLKRFQFTAVFAVMSERRRRRRWCW